MNNGVKHNPALTPHNLHPTDCSQLLSAVWRSPESVHQIGALNRASGRFKNIPVTNIAEAVELACALSDTGTETYFACAEYHDPHSRVADNAAGAYAFWLDLDCGTVKADTGKGYAKPSDAYRAVIHFCMVAGLPEPTHFVSSGGGVHVYWVLDCQLTRADWQSYARMLKALTNAIGLLADPSRTADIASVLRLPGTLNYKYTPPSPVHVIHAVERFIVTKEMLATIDAAHSQWCPVVGAPRTLLLADECPPVADGNRFFGGRTEVAKLASALASLDPDCDEPTWTLKRIAPLARAARASSEACIALHGLALAWSSGALSGIISRAWTTPGGNGLTGAQYFEVVWKRFMTEQYSGRPATLGTIYFDAANAGWVAPTEQFEVIADHAPDCGAV